jgi:hypothetical protein
MPSIPSLSNPQRHLPPKQRPFNCDRAAIATTAIISIVAGALRHWNAGDPAALAAVRAEIENTLRDEFYDVARMARDETSPYDDYKNFAHAASRLPATRMRFLRLPAAGKRKH